MERKFLHEDVTKLIINAFYNVYNKLGYGFLEKVYRNALIIELRKMGLNCIANYQIKVYYDEKEVGFYIADIIVNNLVIIEVKAASALCPEDEIQLRNYLKATNTEVGILLNFGKKAELRRRDLNML